MSITGWETCEASTRRWSAWGSRPESPRIPKRSKAPGAWFCPGSGLSRKLWKTWRAWTWQARSRNSSGVERPFLGICLGLQLLFTEGEEFGVHPGLGVFPGRVVRFPYSGVGTGSSQPALKVPHMGWNSVRVRNDVPALAGIDSGSYFYFVHSYYPVPKDPAIVSTTTDYGGEFVSSIGKGNLFACQFHPEKSQAAGLKILENFGRLAAS